MTKSKNTAYWVIGLAVLAAAILLIGGLIILGGGNDGEPSPEADGQTNNLNNSEDGLQSQLDITATDDEIDGLIAAAKTLPERLEAHAAAFTELKNSCDLDKAKEEAGKMHSTTWTMFTVHLEDEAEEQRLVSKVQTAVDEFIEECGFTEEQLSPSRVVIAESILADAQALTEKVEKYCENLDNDEIAVELDGELRAYYENIKLRFYALENSLQTDELKEEEAEVAEILGEAYDFFYESGTGCQPDNPR